MSVTIRAIPTSEFHRVRERVTDRHERARLVADMCRANALAAVKHAGSGHLGSSFSAMDIVTWLYLEEMNTLTVGVDSPDRDVYYSSKGHDVPGLYAFLAAVGVLPLERLFKLRRFGGLDGHPDVGIPGIEANTGSLGMGISKGRGIAWAKRRLGRGGRVFVMIGDGELQEGQNYEAFQAAAHQQVGRLVVIVDHNKLQSDQLVSQILSLGDLEQKLAAFGWRVHRCDGHDPVAFAAVLAEVARDQSTTPQLVIADTIKGRGVSFMEHPAALVEGKGYYRWHAGAPPDEIYLAAHEELTTRLAAWFERLGLGRLELVEIQPETKTAASLEGEPTSAGAAKRLSAKAEYVADAYGAALVEIAARRQDVVVLDGDLSADCRVRGFELTYPDRFIENGIAEQDMVSMAAGLARHGLLPVVNSFASFLASRANEQIYNAATERSKIIYACHYAGLIPAGPGKSHQSIRDISLLGALPNCVILQPGNAAEARLAVAYAVDTAKENVVLRINIGPSPSAIELPEGYQLTVGRGAILSEGRHAVLFAYGPVMLHEATLAVERLAGDGVGVRLVALPWLNRTDAAWLRETIAGIPVVAVLEDHAPVGGLADHLRGLLATDAHPPAIHTFAVEGYPACGTPPEALRQHRLDGRSLAERLSGLIAPR